MKWLDAATSRLRLLVSPRGAESRMDQEFQLHIDLETERLIREEGLDADEARRRALVAFGGVETHKEALRDGRGLAWLGGFSLDLKLAARMLARYPMLTLVGGAAIAFGIAVGVASFELRIRFIDPPLPLDEGSRIVGIRTWDASLNRAVQPTADQFATWRDALTLLEDVSAFSSFSRNLITNDGSSAPETVAAMSASAFRVARVPPLLGRTLIQSDEDPGAAPVIVIGHDMWNRRFFGDPAVVGRMVRVGHEQARVVGVMPAGFKFPVAHDLWLPLRGHTAGLAPGRGLNVFGRLRRGASREQAQAELTVVGLRSSADASAADQHVRPQLVPYARLVIDPAGDTEITLALANVFVLMILILVSANVALLTFARAASRENEIAVRSSLGASRARIVAQLFVEGLALSAIAVAVGLVSARLALWSLLRMLESERLLPFWAEGNLTPATVIYAGVLTMMSAAIIGVLPALNVTGRAQLDRLRLSTAGGGGYRFGGIWTVVIVMQVAVTLMFPAAAFFFHRTVVRAQTRDIGVAADRYLSARLQLDRESMPGLLVAPTEQAIRVRMAAIYTELERRLHDEPQVAGLAFADQLPGTLHSLWRVELEDAPAPSSVKHRASSASVAPNFFDLLDARILAGRGFTAADVGSASEVVIVNQSFVNQVLGGRNPIGRRIRISPVDGDGEGGPWLEVVGVVRDLGMRPDEAGLYRPLVPGVAELRMLIRVTDGPESFGARLRTVASAVEPTLQIDELMTLDAVGENAWLESQYLSRLTAALSAIALLLSLTTIYSVTAFTVVRRTREIGIRMALGADRRRVVGVILRRPLAQVSIGIVAGAFLVAATFLGLFESAPTSTEAVLIATYAIVMMGVCLLACIVPTRRALRVEPARVLAVDG